MTDTKQFPAHIVAVYGIVKNDKDEILLLKHRDKGIWMFPGGQVELRENLIDALLRETREESSMDIAVERLYCVSSNTGTYQGYDGYGLIPTKVIFGFTCRYLCGDFKESDETSESFWCPKERVLDSLIVPDFIEKFRAYLSFTGEIKYLEYITRPEYMLKTERYI